jgi:hypothetical protein
MLAYGVVDDHVDENVTSDSTCLEAMYILQSGGEHV